jgi:hypothetical protein
LALETGRFSSRLLAAPRSECAQGRVIAVDRALKDVYRADIADYQTYGTWGWRAQKLDRIVDTLHFAPSKFSRLLQSGRPGQLHPHHAAQEAPRPARHRRVGPDVDDVGPRRNGSQLLALVVDAEPIHWPARRERA